MGPIFFLKKEGFQIPPDKKVLKAAEYISYVEAEGIIEKARVEAERIIQAAGQAFKDEEEKGYRAGLEEGKVTCSQQILDTVTSTVDYLGSLEEKVTDVVMKALRKIIGELDDRDLIQRVVRSALSVVRNQKQVTLRVSPEEVETVKDSLNSIIADFPAISFIDVMGDGRLKQGGCILETEIGVVDASIDVQIEAIRKSLLRVLKKDSDR
jgi:type III secretion protein L